MKRLWPLVVLALVYVFQAGAVNPHHQLRVALENEMTKTASGEALVFQMRPILEDRPLIFHCLDLSCVEETRYAYDDTEEARLISVNGHFRSAPFAYLGWILYRSVFRASLYEDLNRRLDVEQVPQVRELEYLVAARGAQYLKDRELTIGKLGREDDYFYSDNFAYARQRELSLLASLRAYERGLPRLEMLVDKRLERVLGERPSIEEYLQRTNDEALKKAAKEILHRYRGI